MRIALGDAAPLYRDAPEAMEAQAAGSRVINRFVREILPGADAATVGLAADMLETTLTQVGSSFSEVPRSEEEIMTFAAAMADMFEAYLKELAGRVS